MKTTLMFTAAALAGSALAIAADPSPEVRQLQVFPKNLARQHLGANLFVFNNTTQTYGASEASAAWLDDDVTTGWPVMAGKQNYLVALSEPELLSNFSVSTRPATGTVTLYAGDEPAAPGAKSWTVIAKDIPLESINDKKMAKPFSRFAKYVLIQTDIAEPGPLYSLYLYGEKPAVSYSLRKREQAIDAKAIFGAFVNNQTNFNVAGLYSSSRISYANSPDGFLSWQKAIDDNPETGVTIAGTTSQSGAIIQLGEARAISRISLLTSGAPKGKIEFFAVKAPAEGVTQVANTSAPETESAASLEGLTPTISMVLDGTNSRSNIEFPQVEASRLLVRWSPVSPSDAIAIREVNAFGGLTLNEYEVSLSPAAVAEFGGPDRYDASKGSDGKDAKKEVTPIALGPTGSPYLPGALGFPPSITARTATIPPSEPVSP